MDLGLAAKVRPALVLSTPPGEPDRALVTLVPHTTALRGSEYEVAVVSRFLQGTGAFNAQGLVTVPIGSGQLVRPLGHLSSQEVQAVERAVLRWLGIGSGGA